MSTLRPVRRVSALVLTVVLAAAPALASGSAPASLNGKVLGADGVSPRAGIVVELVDTADGSAVATSTTDGDGVFRLAEAPEGTYGLVARTDSGVFVATDELALDAGANRPVSLTLSEAMPPVAPGQAAQTGGLPSWARWTIAGTIAVAAAFVIVEASDDVEEPASGF